MEAAERTNEAIEASSRPPEAELRYRLLVQGMEEGVVFHDQDGFIRSTNPSAERILRISADGLLGCRSVLERCEPLREDGAPFALEGCPALICLRTGQSEREHVIGIRHPDEHVSWLSFTSHPLRRGDGGRAGVVTSFRDITALRARESESTQRYEEVSNTVRMHDAFLATAAHELRTPLTALRLQVQNLMRLASSGAQLANEALSVKLERLVRQTERVNSLINLLLDVSRMTVGQLELRRSRFDLAALTRDILARGAEEHASVGIVVEVNAEPAIGEWDEERLEQVLANLVSNAIKYGNGGPVRVDVRAEATRAVLTVSDRGHGIPAADHRRIFERFERAHAGSQSGMGLGLWIVREIVAAHGGSVVVSSAPGQGSTFTVSLPRLIPNESPRPHPGAR